MGVLPAYHARGIGRAMLEHAERWLIERGVRYLLVKTLSARRDCPKYALTRRFYRSVGFVDLEEFPTLWDPRNPCLQLIKTLG